MKILKLLLLFLLCNAGKLFAQNDFPWYKIENNDFSDSALKKFPQYIEIDTSLVGAMPNVSLLFNNKSIKPLGSKFFLPKKIFVDNCQWKGKVDPKGVFQYDESSPGTTHLVLILLPKGMQTYALHKKKLEKKSKAVKSSPYYKIRSGSDTVILGNSFKAYLVVDTEKIMNLSKIDVSYKGYSFERRVNKFRIEIPVHTKNANPIELTIINKNSPIPDTTILSYSFKIQMPKGHVNNNSVEYADEMPKFNSTEFKDFKDYISKKCAEEGIILNGIYYFNYIILKNGRTQLEEMRYGGLNFDEEEKVEKIINNCKLWTPGVYEGKTVNVRKRETFFFMN